MLIIVNKMYHNYNVNIGDDMKNDSVKGIIQLVLAVLFCYAFEHFFFWALGKIGLHFSGDMYLIMNTIKYAILCVIVYIIYQSKIKSSKNKFNKSIITSAIFSIGSFVLLVFVNFILHKAIGTVHALDGYGFSDYFSQSFNLGLALNLIVNVIFKPFLLVVVFCLGVSNIVRKVWPCSILAGILFGLFYAFNLNASIETAFWLSIIPSCVVLLSTYFYKTTQNIWMVYISYVLYIGCGIFVLRYFV